MEKIELRKVRDFGAIFNDCILFLRTNFKSFFGIILVLAGPFIILTGFLSGYMQSLQSKLVGSNIFAGLSGFGSNAGLLSANFIGTLSIFMLIYLLTTLVTSATVCLYFRNYDKATIEQLPLEKNSISPDLASTCWRLFYNMMLLTLIFLVGGGVLVGICAALFMVPVLNVLVGIALVFACIIFLPVVIYVMHISNYIIVRDEILVTAAIKKAVHHLKGNFWWTWLLMFAVGVALATISGLFSLPLSILSMVKMVTRGVNADGGSDHSIMYLIFGALSMICQMLIIVPISTTFCVFNFYSHEEGKEGTGLMSRIDELDIK